MISSNRVFISVFFLGFFLLSYNALTGVYLAFETKNDPYFEGKCIGNSYNITCCDGTLPSTTAPYPNGCISQSSIIGSGCYFVNINITAHPLSNPDLNLTSIYVNKFTKGLVADNWAYETMKEPHSCWFRYSEFSSSLTFNLPFRIKSWKGEPIYRWLTVGFGSATTLLYFIVILSIYNYIRYKKKEQKKRDEGYTFVPDGTDRYALPDHRYIST